MRRVPGQGADVLQVVQVPDHDRRVLAPGEEHITHDACKVRKKVLKFR